MIISLRVYDVGGQSINSKNLKQYLGGTSIIFLVYDLTNPESFQNLEDWLSAARKYSQKARIYLIGNKVTHLYATVL
jgi:Ras-related protein Rab-28